MQPDLSRTLTVGTTCSGKTTFAQRLSRSLDAPHIELDALYWLPGWQERNREDFRDLVAEAAAQESWVADGNYSTVRDLLWPRATAVVWLNYSFPTVMGRALRRTFRRSLRGEELYSGNRETIRQAFFSLDSILRWVVTSYRRRRREYRALFDEKTYPNLATIEFRRPAETERFLERIERP